MDNYEIIEIGKTVEPEYCFKAVVSGNSGVGKTSILRYEVNNEFEQENLSQSVLEHFSKNFQFGEKIIRIQIWDTCGNEMYQQIMKSFYRSALCIFLVFAIDNKNSFLNINKWIEDIKIVNENESPILVLIGNKKDKESERQISKEQIEKYCKTNEIDTYFETSAKTGESIHELFKEVIRKLYIKFIEPITTDVYSTKTFDSTSQNSVTNACGIKSDKCKVCDCLVF